MAGVRDFIGDQNKYELALGKAMGWAFVEDQSKGAGYDYTTPDGTRVEAKFDWDSIKTGNHYLEFEQTSDGGETWVPSGFSLSVEEADLWAVINDEWLRILQTEVLGTFVEENKHALKTVSTRRGVNYNRAGQFSRGHLIPFGTLDEHVMLKARSPVSRS